jgi:hypothetical protein
MFNQSDKSALNKILQAIKDGKLVSSGTASHGPQKTSKPRKQTLKKKSADDIIDDTSVSSFLQERKRKRAPINYGGESSGSEDSSQDGSISPSGTSPMTIKDSIAFTLFKLTDQFKHSFSSIK